DDFDDFYGEWAALVICRQLGLSGGEMYTHGGGTGRILMDDVMCSADQLRLDQCRFRGWGISNCQHYEDIGVRCSPPPPQPPLPSSPWPPRPKPPSPLPPTPSVVAQTSGAGTALQKDAAGPDDPANSESVTAAGNSSHASTPSNDAPGVVALAGPAAVDLATTEAPETQDTSRVGAPSTSGAPPMVAVVVPSVLGMLAVLAAVAAAVVVVRRRRARGGRVMPV
ncbi:Macrophage receptor MARCO, partial [Tetrabaena socialis]